MKKKQWLILGSVIIILIIIALIFMPRAPSVSCDYNSNLKKYVFNTSKDCDSYQITCSSVRDYFRDSCGCGCAVNETRAFICKEELRNLSCKDIYQPVCGWFNDNVSCGSPPCRLTFQNQCIGCLNKNVLFLTKGECPIQDRTAE